MNKKYLIFGGLVLGALALVKKYTTFAKSLTFKIKKAKVSLPFPYNNMSITLTTEVNNPTNAEVELKQLYGHLQYQGKNVAYIDSNGARIKKGKSELPIIVNFSVANLQNVANLTFDTSTFSSVYNQIIRTPFYTLITYVTNLGTFESEDKFKLQDLL